MQEPVEETGNEGVSKELMKRVIVRIVIHAILLCLSALILWFIVPVFGEMYADFGVKLPGPTQFCLNLSDFMKRYGLYCSPLLTVLFWLDAETYTRLYLKRGRKAAEMWFWLVCLLLVLASCLVVVSMFVRFSVH